jgi:autotransporter adhesin
MAAGQADTDAVNVAQLKGVTTAMGGGSTIDSSGNVVAPTYTVNGNTYHDVADAITAAASGTGGPGVNGVAYDDATHAKVTLDGTAGTTLSNVKAGATAMDAVNVAQLTAAGLSIDTSGNVTNSFVAYDDASKSGITLGNGTTGAQIHNLVAGTTATDAVNLGQLTAAGLNVDTSGHVTNSFVAYNDSTTGDGTIAIGGNSSANGKDSIAIGNGATAPADNAVALGANSVADRDNSVSVGSPGNERQITNVAPGTQGTDAVNLNQMNSAVGGIARKAYSGIAAATALTMIPDVDANKTLSIGIGGGTFQGYAATAIGGTARITQNIKVRVGAGWSAAGTTVGAGASYQW